MPQITPPAHHATHAMITRSNVATRRQGGLLAERVRRSKSDYRRHIHRTRSREQGGPLRRVNSTQRCPPWKRPGRKGGKGRWPAGWGKVNGKSFCYLFKWFGAQDLPTSHHITSHHITSSSHHAIQIHIIIMAQLKASTPKFRSDSRVTRSLQAKYRQTYDQY